ncbi:MAG: hypothetical protein HY000_32345 [Planctomycetes bacterium]|nr:hypothetical protein [Planctomycetota bacterium]
MSEHWRDLATGGWRHLLDPGPGREQCSRPISWQGYEINHAAAKYDDRGKEIENAVMTVSHNGALLFDSQRH